MPTPFLPLVMAREFGQSSTQIGMVMSSTPLGACMATPIAASLARNSRRIVYFHSVSLLFIAFTSLLMACLQRFLSTGDVFLAVTSICFTQGMAYALYMAANTTLISRRFTAVAYVVGMAEVAVGFGAQLGRLAGGALYDLGGFGCPFLSAAVCLTICGIIGFSFENRGIVSHGNRAADHADHGNHGDHGCEAKVPWKSFCCPGIWLATSGVFSAYMTTGLVDVTLPQHLESYLGPMPVTEVSAVSSLRSVVYLLTSWLCAQAMHAERAPLEPFLCFGFAFTILGMMTLRPLQWVVDVETAVFHQPPSRVVEWSCQIFSLVIASIGNAFMFIPGLPLMQSHVRHLGAAAAEQVSLLLMMAMFGGEFMGPIAGGALVQRFGLDATTAAFATALLPLFALTAAEIMREIWYGSSTGGKML
ncbi:unnamed protein product [Cladocopium goreaui]|uniref:Protein translocase subunit SecA 2 n=1 Tax=Cladocopium goreaui TaxID=2562237 RepID=A0A9P1G0X9_9DINO|nr:unnamed protein product [Cladocopium goreaui]